jgi:hypothetical protein
MTHYFRRFQIVAGSRIAFLCAFAALREKEDSFSVAVDCLGRQMKLIGLAIAS